MAEGTQSSTAHTSCTDRGEPGRETQTPPGGWREAEASTLSPLQRVPPGQSTKQDLFYTVTLISLNKRQLPQNEHPQKWVSPVVQSLKWNLQLFMNSNSFRTSRGAVTDEGSAATDLFSEPQQSKVAGEYSAQSVDGAEAKPQAQRVSMLWPLTGRPDILHCQLFFN